MYGKWASSIFLSIYDLNVTSWKHQLSLTTAFFSFFFFFRRTVCDNTKQQKPCLLFYRLLIDRLMFVTKWRKKNELRFGFFTRCSGPCDEGEKPPLEIKSNFICFEVSINYMNLISISNTEPFHTEWELLQLMWFFSSDSHIFAIDTDSKKTNRNWINIVHKWRMQPFWSTQRKEEGKKKQMKSTRVFNVQCTLCIPKYPWDCFSISLHLILSRIV